MKDTMIFDLDGTLLDTLDDLADSVNFALADRGMPGRTVEEVRMFVGDGVKWLIKRAVPEATPEDEILAVLAVFKRHYSENMENKTRPYKDIPELLAKAREKGIKIAVVSNKFDEAVKTLCSKYFAGLIDCAIGESENVRRKPAPDSVFAALKVLGSKAENSFYIGDSDTDIKTAENAGVESIGVAWGFRGREALEAAGAGYIAETPWDIMKQLEDN